MVAGRFADDLARAAGSRLVAVGSRDVARGRAFAAGHGGVAAVHGYRELAESDLDIVYVATPQYRHLHDALAVLDAGRSVLVEKPLALRSEGVRTMMQRASAVPVAIEGMWTYFNPLVTRLLSLVRANSLGVLTGFVANCGPLGVPMGHRSLNVDLGGSFLWECLVYPVSLLTALDARFAQPSRIDSVLQVADGTDRAGAVLLIAGDAFAQFGGGVRPGSVGQADSRVQINFERGWVEFDDLYNPGRMRIGWVDAEVEELTADATTAGFGWEIAEVAAMHRGASVPDHASLSQTLLNAELLEQIWTSSVRLRSH